MARANLLNPFGSLPEYENRLTWAFLVAIKYDPLLQNFLRELVESRLPLELRQSSSTWEPACVSTQTSGITSSTSRLVSVLLTDTSIQEVKVNWSERQAVYDGVIEYPNGLTVIIENKLSHGNVWEEQLSPSRNSFSGDVDDVMLHDSAICLEWSEVLEGVLKYADSGIAPFSSREIARDFLSFVEEVHPELTPYRNLKLCGDRPEALNRWVICLVDKLAKKFELERKWNNNLFRRDKIATQVTIWVESKPKLLMVALWPASTSEQADRFRTAVNKEDFLSLNEQDYWKVTPNLNFSFMGTPLFKVTTDWETGRYLEYFFPDERPYERPYGRKSWKELSPLTKKWERQSLISSRDRKEIESQRETNRKYLDVNPQFLVSREWDLDAVIKLEEQGKLEQHIIDELNTVLATWGETIDGSAAS